MAKKEGNWFSRHKILTVIGAIIVIIIIATAASGGTSKNNSNSNQNSNTKSQDSKSNKPNSSTQTEAKIGQAVSDGKFQFTVNAISCGQTQLANDNEFETAKAQGQFCVMKLSIKNTGSQSQNYDDSSQYIYSSDGHQYSSSSDGSMAANSSDSQCSSYPTINPGVSMDCSVAFDVPQSFTPAYAILHDSSLSNGVKVSLQ